MSKEDLSVKKDFYLIGECTCLPLDLVRVFGNQGPVHLEIGCGRGEFIAAKSLLNPGINFLGIEVKEKRIRSILRKLEPERNPNVRLIRHYVDTEIVEILPGNSLERIYIIHPDPWPKRKHFKNRLIQTAFVEILSNLLKPGGYVDVSTDHPEYAQWIKSCFSPFDYFTSVHEDIISDIPPADHVVTHFEKKKKEEGFPPLFLRYRKVES